MNDSLHTKYRPSRFEDVIGQGAVVASLSKVIERNSAQAFLLCGPSGTGKTTLARIAAEAKGCAFKDILEIDAATFTGVDAMRDIQEKIRYRPFGKTMGRAIVIDEAHGLSKQAWNSLLKVIEEPPPHVSFFFCTTEVGKVPATIKTRCAAFTLKPVAERDLTQIVNRVMKAEKFNLTVEIRDLVVKEAMGSPRQALVNLALCRDITDRKEAADVLRTASVADGPIELCRFLIRGGSWMKAMAIIGKLVDENPESIRIIVCNYFGKVAMGSKSDKDAMAALSVIDNFATPYNQSEGFAPLLLSMGRVLLSSD